MNDDINSIGIKTPVIIGSLVVFLFFGVFGLWVTLAPLQSAAIAQGVLAVNSQRKSIQHFEGGIVNEIAVTEGRQVNIGDLLIKLDDTQSKANKELLYARLYAARALESRLLAERDQLDKIELHEDLIANQLMKDVAETIKSQEDIFYARRLSIDGQIAILERRIEQYGEEIIGLTGLIAAEDTQLSLISDEINSNQTLFDQGLTGKARLRELQREMAKLQGERSQNVAATARSKQNIDEARLQIIELRTNTLSEVVQELRETQTNIYDLNEQVRAAEDVMQRTVITASLSGTIVDLQVHTVGGVIAPGQTLMDIVPLDDHVIVEAKIDPSDIDIVQAGLKASIRLTAYSSRNMQPIEGVILTVSADRLTDEQTGLPYFLARVELSGDIEDGIDLYPGMQAEVMVVTGERTVVDYITWPIRQSFNRALREQ